MGVKLVFRQLIMKQNLNMVTSSYGRKKLNTAEKYGEIMCCAVFHDN